MELSIKNNSIYISWQCGICKALGSHRIGEVWLFDEYGNHVCLACGYKHSADVTEALEDYYRKEKWGS